MNSSRTNRLLSHRALLLITVGLLAASFFTSWFFRSRPSVAHQQRLLQDFIQSQEADAARLLRDTALLHRLVVHDESEAEFDAVHRKRYGLFVFAETLSDNQDLLYWNRQDILPPTPHFTNGDSTSFQRLPNGFYLVRKTPITLPGMSSTLVAYVLVPVLHQYYLQTQNSPTQFAHNKEAINKIRLADTATEYPVRSVSGKTLFYVEPVAHRQTGYTTPLTFILRLLALAFVLLYLQTVVAAVNQRRGAVAATLVLVVVLALCRLVLFLFPNLFSLRQLPLFDPLVYASDFVNRSLGDLLLNALFFCWLVVFAWNNLGPVKRLPRFFKGPVLMAAGVAAIFLLVFASFQLADIIYDLVANSKISFDVTNFFGLNVYTVFGFFVLALATLTYYYFSRLLFRFILLAFPNLLLLYFITAVVGLAFLSLRADEQVVLFQLPVLAWLLVYTLLLSQEGLIINRLRITVAGMLFWIFVFSVSLALLIMQGNHAKEWRERRAIAEKYDQLSEPSKERTLNVALAFLTNDFLRDNFHRFYQEPVNRELRDSFINTNSLGYAASYTTSFYVFDAERNPVNNADNRSYEELNNILELQSKPISGTSGLSFYETAYDQFIYITRREVRDSATLIGSLFIVSAPKHFQTANDLYPNIFRRDDRNNLDNSPYYSYGIYRNNKLIRNSSKYPFPTQLPAAAVPSDELTRQTNGDNTELWYKPANNKLVVVAKKKDSLLEGITLFSYLFCAFLFMVGALRVAGFFSRVVRNRYTINLFTGLNIRTQIHGTIIFISVLSFLIIGAATISFFIVRYNRNNVDRLSRNAAGAVTEMEQRINEANLLANNVINFSDSTTNFMLRNVVREIADVHGMIVNVYDLSGTLRITSDDQIYDNGLLSNRMHPKAFYNLHTLNHVQQVQDEDINQIPYQSIYVAMRNTNGDTYAYLNVPSFTSQTELKQEISNFFVTIINLNAFIFLVAGVIALFITNRITRSFSVIGDKMKALTLGKTAEEIVWTRNDEIGELVKQYNKMVHQLEQSAAALAKSEREGAWREMARQVAHEIKNPLTPMKLSIQYLQRAIQTGQANVQQLTSNVASTLIEQIDHLSKIAADFSQFANIGNRKLEAVDLRAVLRSLVDLYAANPHIRLQWHALGAPLPLNADKTHMNRLFTNLLTNAVDACAESRACVVTINEEIEGRWIVVSVSDNGEGIPPEMQSKIFTPNFTTKTSGTGLGLAMCKSIVEQAGGDIWFETMVGEGTTFFVRLPLRTPVTD